MPSSEKRAQTTTEYLFLAVGVIIFVVLVYTLLQGNILGGQSAKTAAGVTEFLKVGEYFLFFDNFDSGADNQWTQAAGAWEVNNNEYAQTDTTDEQKNSFAGSSGWVNYYADAEIQFTSLPAEAGILGGIAGRVNKNTGARYVCAFDLTSAAEPKEGRVRLYRFTDWQSYAILSSSPTFEIDTTAHAIAIQVNGNDIKCFWDAEEILTYNDATPFKFGMLALEQRLTETHFDTVRAKYQEGPTPSGPNPTPIVSPSPTPSPSPFPSPSPSGLPSPSIIVLQCSDGTPIRTCSASQPLYCVSLQNLENKCSSCGCPLSEPYCRPDESCSAVASLYIANNQHYGLGYDQAIIAWSTSIYADGVIEYGLDANYGSNQSNVTPLKSHYIKLSSLTPSTLYHYRITSCNATLCNSTIDSNFTTLPPFALGNVTNTSVTQTTFYVNWDTNHLSNGTVEYGLTDSYGSTKSHSNLLKVHSVQILGLTADTLYHYRVTSCNATACNTSEDYQVRTIPDPYCWDGDISYGNLGINPTHYANATIYGSILWDQCSTPQPTYDTQIEYYCPGTSRKSVLTNCNNCTAGVCTGNFCADTNVGYGKVFTNFGIWQDSCDTQKNEYTDYYCNGVTIKVTYTSPCPSIN